MLSAYQRRKIVDRLGRTAAHGASLVAVVVLVNILGYVAWRGVGGLSWALVTDLPGPAGESGGGMGNAIVGTLTILGLAAVVGLPVGILTGVYLAELGSSKVAIVVRFAADVLAGVPSIVVGVFVYGLVVLPMHRFSAIAGAVALAVLMLPSVARTTEELLRLVPHTLREAALALGVPKWRTTLRVVLRTAAPGVVTGVMLAVARAAGETAPLLFTALGSQNWARGIDEPTASLPVQIYTYAVSPYESWHAQAWAAALLLVVLVLVLNLAAHLLVRHRVGSR
ncbi:MAG: phosphate ABC transporter permease PstA [Myxococcota bacterium]